MDTPTDSRGIYTPMTRGREANHAYVVTEDNRTAFDVLTQTIARDWIDQPALARRLQLDPQGPRPIAPKGPSDEKEVDESERRILELVAERKERNRRVGRSLSIGL